MADTLDAIYETVGEELTRGFQSPGPLARAIEQGRGDRDLTRSLYVTFRVEELLAHLGAAAREQEARLENERRVLIEHYGFYPNVVAHASASTAGFDAMPLERKVEACKAAESAHLLYQGAHDAHYRQFDVEAATAGYRRLVKFYPQSSEARWAKEQLANIESMTPQQREAYEHKRETRTRSR